MDLIDEFDLWCKEHDKYWDDWASYQNALMQGYKGNFDTWRLRR